MTVAAILKQKGYDVFSVLPGDTFGEVVRSLSVRRMGCAVVKDAAGHLLGIINERDIVNAIAANGAWSLEMSAEQVMHRVAKTATPQTTTGQALAIMATSHLRHLPVIEKDTLVGLISIGDVVKDQIMQHVHEVDELRAYVSGVT
jgi:CBS domain-containing protein